MEFQIKNLNSAQNGNLSKTRQSNYTAANESSSVDQGKYNETNQQNESNVEGSTCTMSPEADESKILCLEGSGVKFQHISPLKSEHVSSATSSLPSTSEIPKGKKSFKGWFQNCFINNMLYVYLYNIILEGHGLIFEW